MPGPKILQLCSRACDSKLRVCFLSRICTTYVRQMHCRFVVQNIMRQIRISSGSVSRNRAKNSPVPVTEPSEMQPRRIISCTMNRHYIPTTYIVHFLDRKPTLKIWSHAQGSTRGILAWCKEHVSMLLAVIMMEDPSQPS